ncbi:UNVERIFIED_CONTAM: hypothetical protein K2H54_036417 [Gekko kuhli]
MRSVYLLFVLGVLLFHIAAAQSTSCELLGGYCRVPVNETCPFGPTLRGKCEINGRCCMLIPTTCEALGGECLISVNGGCPYGEDLPVKCGFNERCCKPYEAEE